MTILALDLASVTGWAYGPPGDTPTYGSLRFAPAGAERAAYFRGLRYWLATLMRSYPLDIVVFEAPIPASFLKGHTNMNTTMLLYGLANHVEEFFFERQGIKVYEANVGDIRRHFLGVGGRPLKRVDAKAATLRKCRALGWLPQDENAADALALWHYLCSLIKPELAIQTSPLFRRRAREQEAFDYDANADFAGSINEGFSTIRKRVAAGGPPWTPRAPKGGA